MPIQKITREEIVNKCVERFRTHGFHRTTMSDLAEVCGLQKGSFYHHFTSKDEILQQGLVQTSQFFQDRVFAIAYDETLSSKERMKSMLDRHVAIMLREYGGCLVANLAAEALHTTPTVRPLLVEISNNWAAALQHILAVRHSSGKAQTLAWRIIEEIEGAIMLTKLYSNETFVTQAMARATEQA